MVTVAIPLAIVLFELHVHIPYSPDLGSITIYPKVLPRCRAYSKHGTKIDNALAFCVLRWFPLQPQVLHKA